MSNPNKKFLLSESIFFEAVLLSLPQTVPNGQVVCRDCENQPDDNDFEHHECYYMTIHGFVSSNLYRLIEDAGRGKIIEMLGEIIKKDYKERAIEIFVKIFGHVDPYQELMNNETFSDKFLVFVKEYDWNN